MKTLFLVLFAVLAISTTASAQNLVAKGLFREPALNTLTDKFAELKSIEKCGFYRGQWAIDGKWDDRKVSLYAASAYQRFEGELSQAELVTIPNDEVSRAIGSLMPKDEMDLFVDLEALAATASKALAGKKIVVSAGRISSSSTAVNVVVFSNKKTKEFLSLGVRPTCSK
jgi:hypothetical protein